MENILNCGITRNKHKANVKNKAPVKTFKSWLKRIEEYLSDAEKADDAPVGAAIRKNRTKTKNSQGEECRYITRLLGGNNKALAITIDDERVSVFPSQSFEMARNILGALLDAVKNNEAVQLEIATELASQGFEDAPTTFVEGGV